MTPVKPQHKRHIRRPYTSNPRRDGKPHHVRSVGGHPLVIDALRCTDFRQTWTA